MSAPELISNQRQKRINGRTSVLFPVSLTISRCCRLAMSRMLLSRRPLGGLRPPRPPCSTFRGASSHCAARLSVGTRSPGAVSYQARRRRARISVSQVWPGARRRLGRAVGPHSSDAASLSRTRRQGYSPPIWSCVSAACAPAAFSQVRAIRGLPSLPVFRTTVDECAFLSALARRCPPSLPYCPRARIVRGLAGHI